MKIGTRVRVIRDDVGSGHLEQIGHVVMNVYEHSMVLVRFDGDEGAAFYYDEVIDCDSTTQST